MMNNYNRSQIKWGIILIGLGVLFLLNTMGVVVHFNWGLLLHFWPVIIIIIGVNIILKNTPLWWLTPLIFVFGIIALFFVGNGSDYYHYHFNTPFIDNEKNIYRSGIEMTQDIKNMDIALNFSAGRIIVDSVRDKKNLYETRLKYRNNSPDLDYLYNKVERTGYLFIKESVKNNKWFNIPGSNDWELYISPKIPLKMNIDAGAGDFNFNMEDLLVTELVINSGAGDLEIDLGNSAQYLEINSAAASMELNIPDDKAVSIKTAGLISSNNFTNIGLIKIDNNLYQTPDYQKSINKLNIEINSPASNINIDFYRMD